MKKAEILIRQKKWIFVGIIILIVIIIFFSYKNGNGQKYTNETVKLVDIYEEVAVTGRVLPDKSVDLSFDKTGKVKGVNVKVGDIVKKDQILAFFDSDDQYANLRVGKAELLSADTKLTELKNGTRPEELAVYQRKFESANASYETARQTLEVTLRDTYLKIVNALRNGSDIIFDNGDSVNPTVKTGIVDSGTEKDWNIKRLTLTESLDKWQKNINSDFSDQTDSIPSDITLAKDNLNLALKFLDSVWTEISALTATDSSLDSDTIEGYRLAVSNARNDINTAGIALSNNISAYKLTETGFNTSAQELELVNSGSTVEAIKIQEANVAKAQAGVEVILSQIDSTLIEAPFDGVVTKVEPEVGEVFNANTLAIALMSDSSFKIEVKVPEVDIVKLSIGNKAKVTLDAYGKDQYFDATVILIDPAEEIFEGVPSYKVTLIFDNADSRILSGMTANIEIFSDLKTVLGVSQKAIMGKDSGRYVKINNADKIEDRKVKIGRRGVNGYSEILEGLREGEEILVPDSNIK